MDDVSEQRLALVWPTLADRIRTVAVNCANQGIYIRVVQGLRTAAEQDALYAQGRVKPITGPIVTNVRGGYSWHNFGCAVDCVPSLDGPNKPFNPNWNAMHPNFKAMVQFGRLAGLTCGADWISFVDNPHFQLTGQYPVNEPSDLVRQLASKGLPSFWSTIVLS